MPENEVRDRVADWKAHFILTFDRELELAEEAREVGTPFTVADVDSCALRVLASSGWYPRGSGEE